MVFASALRTGAARDAIVCGRNAVRVAAGVRRMAAAAAVRDSDASPLYPDAVLQAPETQMATLGNGVRVATEAGGGQLASLTISVDTGSRYETTENNGTCSVLGAAAFKGKEVSIAAMGGKFSVNVDRENMTYNATVLKDDVPKAMEVLAAAVKASGLTSETAEAGKASIQQQLAAVRANPQLNLMDHLHDAAFLDTTMGLPVIGTAASVDSLTLDGLKAFADKSAAGPRIVVAGAGAVHQGALTDMAASLLGDLASTPAGAVEESLEPAHFIGSDKRIRFDSMKEAHIAFCVQAPPAGSEHTYPLALMGAIMGSYDERDLIGKDAVSKWRQHLAELNLARKAAPFYLPYKTTGLFGVSSIVTDNNIDNYMWYTLWNLLYLCHKVTDFDLEVAKTALKQNAASQVSTCEAKAADIARQIRHHVRRHSPAEFAARVDAVTKAQVKATAYEFISDQDHALTAVGPIHELPDYNWIRRRSYWLRY